MLRMVGIKASYGVVQILNGVDLELGDNEIVAILGRNGAGKTTLIRLLMGLLKPTHGKVELDGQTISGQPPHVIARQGIAYVPQGRGIFPKLTVHENLMVGTRAQGKNASGIPSEIFSYFPILHERLDQPGGTLSGGEQQQLAIGRALCGKPKILLLDEPSDGIQPNIVQQIGALLAALVKQADISILIVEQNLDLALHVAHRCVIMNKGCIVYRGSPEEFKDEGLLKKYLAI